jgi:AAA+ ATPase superfamily predicted ATPase
MAICKLFDPYPKSSREEFFDNEEIIDEVEKLLEGKFWPLIIGPKRTGKTSILKIVSNELKGVYIDASGIKSLKELGEALVHSLQAKIQIGLKVVRIEINRRPVKGLQDLLNKLDEMIILIDEVQNIISPWFISLLSNAYNNSEVKFALTGSMIGLTKTLIGQGKGKKLGTSFKGRPIVEIEAEPFNDDKSREFLEFGSKMCNLNITDNEVEDVVKVYRGIQGWLTYYGNFRSLGYSHDKAKEIVLKIAKSIIRDEIRSLSETQRTIIKALSLVESVSWKNLKNLSESIGKSELDDWIFNNALKQLINARLVKKGNDGKYSLIDPMYKYFIY